MQESKLADEGIRAKTKTCQAHHKMLSDRLDKHKKQLEAIKNDTSQPQGLVDNNQKKNTKKNSFSGIKLCIFLRGIACLAMMVAAHLCMHFLKMPSLFPLITLFIDVAAAYLASLIFLRSSEVLVDDKKAVTKNPDENDFQDKIDKIKNNGGLKKNAIIAVICMVTGVTLAATSTIITLLPIFNKKALALLGPNLLSSAMSTAQIIAYTSALLAGILLAVGGVCIALYINQDVNIEYNDQINNQECNPNNNVAVESIIEKPSELILSII